MTDSAIEQVVPDFELLAKVGEGSYGEVYLAKSQTGQYRAVKIINRNRMGSYEAFDREFRGAKVYEVVSRKHEALIDILHVGCDAERGFFYYVMDAADDERQGRNFDPSTYRPRTLRYELATRTALPVEECIAIGLRLASALVFLQQHGLIHRDIKPSNVVFIDGQLKLADIGLVVDVHEAKSVVGTPIYMSPEHHGDFSGDVYSLGKLLYEISTGQSAGDFGAAPTDEADTDDPRFAQLNKIILKACAEHPKDRYQTAFGLFKALQELQKGTEIPKRQPGIRYVPLLRLALAGAAVVVLGSVIVSSFLPKPQPPAITRIAKELQQLEDAGHKPHVISPGELREMRVNFQQMATSLSNAVGSAMGGMRQAQAQAEDDRKRAKAVALEQKQQAEKEQQAQAEEEHKRAQAAAEEQKQQAEVEQKTRAQHAQTALSQLSFKPDILLDKRLTEAGATTRITGPIYEQLVKCAEEKNWLGMMGLASRQSYAEYPPVTEIDDAQRRLAELQLSLVVTLKREIPAEWTLYFAGLTSIVGKPGLSISDLWDEHPDGKSRIHSWRPDQRVVLVVLGPERWLRTRLIGRRNRLDEQVDACEKLLDIGEIDQRGYEAKIRALRQTAATELREWATGELEQYLAEQFEAQAETEAAKQREAQRRAKFLETEQKRPLGTDAAEWIQAWNQYWVSVHPEKITVYVDLPNGEMPEERYVMPGPEIPMGPWRREKVEGVDSFKMDEVQIGFGNLPFAQVSLVMKDHNGRTGLLEGDYETRGNALRMEFENAQGAKVDHYYFFFVENRLVLKNSNCRMTFAELPANE
jgi:serine/threonine protein kinase